MSDRISSALARALRAEFAGFPGAVTVEPIGHTTWASVTFSGARHRLHLSIAGEGAAGAAADFLARMEDVEFAIPGQIVADLALVAEERREGGGFVRLELEALTIEDG